MKLVDFAAALGIESVFQTIAVIKLKGHIQKRGYGLGWIVNLYQFIALCAVEGLASSQMLPSVAKILPASHTDFEKLFAYSADIMGSSQVCKLLLGAWLCHLQKSSWVAIDVRDKIVGYLIMSDIIHPPENAFCKERVIWARSWLLHSPFIC